MDVKEAGIEPLSIQSFKMTFGLLNGASTLSRLPSNYGSGSGTNQDEEPRQVDSPPAGRRFVLSFCLLACGLFVSIFGWLHVDNERLAFSSPWIWLGGILYLSGFGLWWITFAFPATWSWWL